MPTYNRVVYHEAKHETDVTAECTKIKLSTAALHTSSSSSAFIGHIQQFEYSAKGGGFRARTRERTKERGIEKERERERGGGVEREGEKDIFFFREGHYLP